MPLTELKKPEFFSHNEKLMERYQQLATLIEELRFKNLSEEIISKINLKIDAFNNSSLDERTRIRQIRKQRWAIIQLIEKKLKIVPKNYYRNFWMMFGMSAFGIPMGVAFGVSQHNMAFISIGIPIGFAIGIAIGVGMDKKAQQEGRQLSFEAKY